MRKTTMEATICARHYTELNGCWGDCLLAPTKWVICDDCRGNGTHVNPAIDGDGITGDDWAEWELDDREAYLTGGMDVRCSTCDGAGKALALNAPSMRPADLKEWQEQADEHNHDVEIARRERAAERRMGA